MNILSRPLQTDAQGGIFAYIVKKACPERTDNAERKRKK